MADFAKRRAAFRDLHKAGCFVLPNPWDVGSARMLRSMGFKALATTSSGFALSQGLTDSPAALSRDRVLRHYADIVAATDLPVNADFQDGYADTAEGVAESVRLCIETGVAGLSIEDANIDSGGLYELQEAVDRLRAARSAIDDSGVDVMLTARAECFLTGHPNPLEESIRRLQAYAEAGADVLFAPCPPERATVAALVQAVSPKPVNVIVYTSTEMTVLDIANLGGRRISVGSALARAAWTGFMGAVGPLVEAGSFEGFDGLASYGELVKMFP